MGEVLSLFSDFWGRAGFSGAIAALASLVITLSVAAGILPMFQPVIAQLVDWAAKVWSDMQETINVVRGLLRGVADVTGKVSMAIAPQANAANTGGGDAMALTVTDAVMAAPAMLSALLIFAGALFFFC